MKIIALSDLHNVTNYIEPLAEKLSTVDLVLLTGDLTHAGKAGNVSQILESIKKYNKTILAVSGNWDGREVEAFLESEGISLHRKHIIFGDVAFLGVGGALSSGINSPNEISEKDFELFLNQADPGIESQISKILVCHHPPFDTLTDKTWMDDHVGSKSVRSFIETTQPLVCFTGHIHEAIGIDTIGVTKIINPGPIWKNQYAYAEIIDQRVDCLEIRSF
jgi:Icc-related predicted phosphoesterase